MAKQQTNSMKMNKWSSTDTILPEDLSSNFDVLDEEMKSRGINVKWFGAVGDGTTDDTAAFQAAMAMCEKRYKMFVPAGNYRIRQTIENNSRGIFGVAPYVDSGQTGTRIIWDPLDTTTDLLPCIRIRNAGVKAVFEDFGIYGILKYSSRNLSTWVNKDLFEQSSYDMFSEGTAAIEIAGSATPIFRNISTSGVKVGQLLNSSNGHISSYDCNWNGLIGVYCRINSGDYFYQGSVISGAFCGIMIGTILTAGHRGGFNANIYRTHLGFSPYAIYQCIDSGIDDYNNAPSVLGISGIYNNAQFEQCGEAAIKLLTKSLTSNLRIFGFGFSWSVSSYSGNLSGWEYPLPDDLKKPSEKQQYAAWFGTITAPTAINDETGKLRKSTAQGAIGSAYIDTLTGDKESDLTGLTIEDTVIRRKITPLYKSADLQARMQEREHRALMPVSAPNLLRNPEVLSNWSVANGGVLSLVAANQVPIPITNEMKQIIGNNPVILKVTPNGVNSPSIRIKFNSQTLPYHGDADRNLAMQYFILETEYESSSMFKSMGRISAQNAEYIFNDAITWKQKGWKHLRGRELASKTGLLNEFSIFFIPKVGETYIAGVMVTWDHIGSYSPYPHSYMTDSLEIGGLVNGIILTDSVTSVRYQLSVTNGVLQIKPIT
ncbi:glycoside hydrolase family 55 protein [Paenibacillus sp. N3/727]|uniref:glycoside hydrolase family 55 protein n=1 Tax=Paenibacillus sp. N3/727 TaxID=2925845 RepID=UPI001F538C48|nr:glycoside hydrolase family 55 protein [Paenibacillus sp. N3/727]UNK18759.1 glycoside hydrolase family 55 protein [Paenibacillus sp. N3/727]